MEKTEKMSIMRKTALISFVVLLFVLFASLFVKTFSILLLLFGGLLLSIFFQAISNRIHGWTGWHKGVTLTLAFFLVFGFISGVTYLIGNTMAQQYEQFKDGIPKTVKSVESYLEDTSWGDRVKELTPSMEENGDQVMQHAGSFFKSTFGFFGDLYAVIFLGLFMMISPKEYKNGIVTLVPKRYKPKADHILSKMGNDLKVWLKAQMLEMAFVFTLTAIGALILGAELWLILAIIGGTLTFIPNIGPTLALIPATLIGLMDGPEMALWLVGLFLLIQLLESGIFGPFVRKKMLSLPPALVLFFQLLMGSISGAWGILFATPILVVIMVLIQEIYLKGMLEQAPETDE
ncbi:AI-2E family transporter [Sphingobacterium sp. lm-10]|uniref:AI-2E family transporter n=1 Tax=Sphingobacterium sp. lm-10 TaxID=2944904 RepID=UPI0020218EE9|nr:AI-2E family transporter [Sphingobacterium sp. lm-10]MCL7986818.1 AI-2E family transporter [Sphingobacterium sp. lm-10]